MPVEGLRPELAHPVELEQRRIVYETTELGFEAGQGLGRPGDKFHRGGGIGKIGFDGDGPATGLGNGRIGVFSRLA